MNDAILLTLRSELERLHEVMRRVPERLQTHAWARLRATDIQDALMKALDRDATQPKSGSSEDRDAASGGGEGG